MIHVAFSAGEQVFAVFTRQKAHRLRLVLAAHRGRSQETP